MLAHVAYKMHDTVETIRSMQYRCCLLVNS